jgi:putative acetyltransferase
VIIAAATPADRDDVLRVERAAFPDEDVAGLVAALLDDSGARPLLSLVARDEGKPVGHILFSAARLDGASRDVPISILAPLAVVPEAQRRGIGGRLIEHGIQLLTEAGIELVFVLGDPGYYPRHCFTAASPCGLAAPYPISPDDAWMVRALRPDVVGAVRGTVRCADAMDRPEYWRE